MGSAGTGRAEIPVSSLPFPSKHGKTYSQLLWEKCTSPLSLLGAKAYQTSASATKHIKSGVFRHSPSVCPFEFSTGPRKRFLSKREKTPFSSSSSKILFCRYFSISLRGWKGACQAFPPPHREIYLQGMWGRTVPQKPVRKVSCQGWHTAGSLSEGRRTTPAHGKKWIRRG